MVHEQVQSAASRPTLIYQPPSYVQRLEWTSLFARPQPLEIELGSGDGSFLIDWARRNPERNFLGVERLKGRLRKLERKGARAGLTNLRGLRLEAAYCVEFLIPPASVHAFHLYFPDPWPKRKHQRHRLVNPRFAEAVAQALVPGGEHLPPHRRSALLRHHAGSLPGPWPVRSIATPPALAAVVTDFEREFLARGIPTWHAAYRVRAV